MKKIWEELEQIIIEKYQISGQEWVQADVSKRGKIHITIVSDNAIPKAEVRSLIEASIANYQEAYQEEYQIGFIDIFTIERAKEYNIVKTEKKSGYASWSDALYAAEEEQTSSSDMQVISFYSYKGGVGRTIALIETAYLLAKAGKRILLLDLDIEAPSLHNIFAEKVNHPTRGVQYGIVEYLYRKTVQKQGASDITPIFCSLELQNVPGEIYLIPALKNMSKDYLYQIERLQTLHLQEQDAFKDIFDYVKVVLNVDIIMIDTRAGFNKWGSLSLLTLSDQVIFIAYANSENVEGLNTAFELLHNAGKKRYAVAMSKVVASNEGLAKAKALFSDLFIPQEQLIPIYYKEEIALSREYPIVSQNVLEAYHKLSRYILDSDRISRNRAFLANGMKEHLLGHLFLPQKRFTVLADVERFSWRKTSTILKYTYSEELYGLKSMQRRKIVRINQGWVPIPVYLFTCMEQEAPCSALLAEKWDDIEEAGIQLLNMTIADSDAKNKNIISAGNKSIQEILACLRQIASEAYAKSGDDGFSPDFREFDAISELRIIISVSDKVFRQNPRQTIENMRNLITKFNQETEVIQFKFVVNADIWDEYQESAAGFKGMIQEINICEEDIRKFLMLNLNLPELKSYQKYIGGIETVSEEREMKFRFQDIQMTQTEMREIIGLVLGIRQNVRVYSSSVMTCIYRKLQENPERKYDRLLDALKIAAETELLHMEEADSDRLLSYHTLRAELDAL